MSKQWIVFWWLLAQNARLKVSEYNGVSRGVLASGEALI